MKHFVGENKRLLSEWDNKKNVGLKPSEVIIGSSKKVWWKCKFGHEWLASPRKRNDGQNCPYCSSKRILSGFNDLLTKYPKIAKEWDYNKNTLKPDKVFPHSNKKVWWICKKGHSYLTSPNNKVRGENCPYCANKKVLPGYNDLKTVYPDIALEWDYKKNYPLRPENVLYGSGKTVFWECKVCHGSYKAPVVRRSKKGCPYCANKNVLIGYNDLATKNPKLAEEWNYDKNGNITPKDIVAGSTKKVWWKCKEGHEWQASIVSRNRNHFCPVCDRNKHTSLSEKAFVYYLRKNNVQVEENKKICNKEIDIYLPNNNVGIEYDGERYHSNVEKDLIKNDFFEKKQIKLIRIREPKLPKLNSSSIDIHIDKLTSDYSYLNKPIIYVLKLLGLKNVDVNVDRDIQYIYDIFINKKDEDSIIKTHPELVKEWDYERNTINPEKVTKGMHIKAWWICNECGYRWQSQVYTRCSGSNCPKCAQKKFGSYHAQKVGQYDKKGKLIKIFDSISEAERITGAKNIFYVCSGKRESSNGFIWKYIKDENI